MTNRFENVKCLKIIGFVEEHMLFMYSELFTHLPLLRKCSLTFCVSLVSFYSGIKKK